jgi:tRNA (cytidine/uridine-2'-O-)-methyltransferase
MDKELASRFALNNTIAGSESVKKCPPLNIVLYEPEIAANTGAVGRTCVGLGAKLWLVEPLGFQIDDRKLKRAGLDYWTYLEWEIVPCWTILKKRLSETNEVDESELRYYYFSKNAKQNYDAVSYQLGDAFVFGSESRGLPTSFIEDGERALRIPISPKIRSLNLSVSVALASYEARRQLRFYE